MRILNSPNYNVKNDNIFEIKSAGNDYIQLTIKVKVNVGYDSVTIHKTNLQPLITYLEESSISVKKIEPNWEPS